MGRGLRVVGANALYAYEAAAGVRFPAEVTTTEDIDMLLNARARMVLSVEADDEGTGERRLIGLLRRVDRAFHRVAGVGARNREGHLVDLIRPARNPPWQTKRRTLPGELSGEDREAVGIDGLAWHESAPAFSAIAIDHRGYPVRIATSDPRAFGVHKLWLSARPDREALESFPLASTFDW